MNEPTNILLLTLLFASCATSGKLPKEIEVYQDRITHSGIEQNRNNDIMLIDKLLKEQGDFGVYGNLSTGLGDVLGYMYVDIEIKGESLNVNLYPLSQVGHDVSFSVDKKNFKILNLVVGELIPPPTN